MRRTRGGITLLELLIVMVILLMITAAAIPIIAPATRNRAMRESTRLTSSYLGEARARAVQTGRPVGVVIERNNGLPFAFTMAQIEVPPPYSGDVVGATAVVAITTPGTTEGEHASRPESEKEFNDRFNLSTHTRSAVWFTAETDTSTCNAALIRVGDTIQFGGQGYRYAIWGPDIAPVDGVIDSAPGTVRLDIAYEYPDGRPYTKVVEPLLPSQLVDHVFFPWANAPPLPVTQPAAYTIFRQPVRTTTPPLQLPDGIAFDLSVSGVGSSLFNAADYSGAVNTAPPAPVVQADPMIVFSPSGRLDFVTNAAGQLVRPTDAVYLLIGRRELMFDATAAAVPVAKDLVFQNLSARPPDAMPATPMPPAENFWVTIGYQSGLVTVSEVATNSQDYTNAGFTTQAEIMDAAIQQSRAFAVTSQSVGGR